MLRHSSAFSGKSTLHPHPPSPSLGSKCIFSISIAHVANIGRIFHRSPTLSPRSAPRLYHSFTDRAVLAIEMFSTAVNEGGPAMATRSRRRQRPVSSDSLVQQPKAKRQRLPLTEQTFVNPDAPPEMFEVKSDKVATLDVKQDGIENFAVPKKDLQLRAKKPKPGERVAKGDGTIILVCIVFLGPLLHSGAFC